MSSISAKKCSSRSILRFSLIDQSTSWPGFGSCNTSLRRSSIASTSAALPRLIGSSLNMPRTSPSLAGSNVRATMAPSFNARSSSNTSSGGRRRMPSSQSCCSSAIGHSSFAVVPFRWPEDSRLGWTRAMPRVFGLRDYCHYGIVNEQRAGPTASRRRVVVLRPLEPRASWPAAWPHLPVARSSRALLTLL
jgi:hypothetical protein